MELPEKNRKDKRNGAVELPDEVPGGMPRKFSTTPGTRDMLPPEAMRLFDVERRAIDRFRAHGFREVVTPALEYAEVMEEPHLRDASFKLFDPDNQMLLLRPEMTTPIARLVAQRLKDAPVPHKLSYCLPVYRRSGVGRGQSAEFHQAGVEVVGSASPGEDAGAISLLMDVLESFGLTPGEDFSVVLGQASFYKSYVEENAGEAAAELLEALAAKDLVRVDEISRNLPRNAEGIREIPRLVGRADDEGLLDAASGYATGRAAAAFGNLKEILGYLEAVGRTGGVILDLGLIGRYGYYTGAVYEVYARGMGFSVASGGRYDGLLSRFGEEAPATGFAISLERLIQILPEKPPAPLLLMLGRDVRAAGMAARLRESGVAVLHVAEDFSPGEARRYARSVGADSVVYPDDNTEGNDLKFTPVAAGDSGTLTVDELAAERGGAG
ncbi:ATP phosphoribosyltransferase regulatory subunit [Rubrobacter indicoceani]|uniref:ATP phosphoribosyltransferase regulatory subunit n=1 Tax=Rubrobacter indicoceani TaxID=2051957 RepID=UPI000E5A935F|nr:ATP phosphoribosyltransferase regulatory subunit [Rubrobacter indicoceani]